MTNQDSEVAKLKAKLWTKLTSLRYCFLRGPKWALFFFFINTYVLVIYSWPEIYTNIMSE